MAIETGNPGPRLPPEPIPDASTPERDRRVGRRPESNGNRPLSLDILSNLHKKRKASQMEDSGDTYEATHIRPSIKDDSGMSTDDSPTSSVGSSPRALPIKQALSTSKVLQGRSSANGNRGVTIFGPSPILHDSSGVFDKSADWPGDDRQKATNLVDRRVSSSSTELSMWDVSESETHTTDKEEESSDGESVGSAFSPGMDRGKSVKSEESPQGSDYLQRGKSNYTSSRRSAIQEQDYIPSAEPTEPVINGHDRTEHTTRQNRRISHNHDDRISDEPDAIPANGSIRRNIETTTKGKRRQRAAAKTHISARDISHSWRTANAADKMLVKMKAKGCSWLEIRKAWEELTGEWPATSTLPNRYSRVKNNLMRLKSGDGKRLLDAVAEVEAQFQHSKWRKIAEAMQDAGAAQYSRAFIQRKYQELSRKGTLSDSGTDGEGSDASESGTNLYGDKTSSLRQRGAGPTTGNLSHESTRQTPP